ncbi:MAG: hypothetical protein H6828_04015 [Planctomycetes bacterium]|nr:hypothetical protein [Planctomycetota bacterium]
MARARALAATGDAAGARALVDGAEVDEATRDALVCARARGSTSPRTASTRWSRRSASRAACAAPERAEAWWLCGAALARRGELAAAAPLLRRLVTAWPLDADAPAAWHLLAQEALARRDVEAAKACRDRGRELATWHGYYRTRRLQVRAAPDEPLPRLGLAQLWLSVDALEPARAELLELVRRAPDFARGWALLGEVERKLEHRDAALVAYDAALARDETLADVRFNRALLRLAAGDAAAARTDLERLVQGATANEPRYALAHLHLARLLKAAGEDDAAAARYAAYRALGGTEAL